MHTHTHTHTHTRDQTHRETTHMGTLRNQGLTQGCTMPMATHEPFRAKQTWTEARIVHDLLVAFVRKFFVLRHYHTMGYLGCALH